MRTRSCAVARVLRLLAADLVPGIGDSEAVARAARMTRRLILLPLAVFAGLALLGLADLLRLGGWAKGVWRHGP